MRNQQKAILFLEDGLFFKGKSLGSLGQTSGEVCFNTGMTGYQEILTDPSYAKQMIVMCSPHIGNYGTNESDVESSNIYASGFIIKNESLSPSNWRSTSSLEEFLKSNKVVGIQDIDTRALTIHIRNNGSMRGIISTNDFDINSLAKKIEDIPSMEGLDLAKEVSRSEKTIICNVDNPKYKIAAIDYGMKLSLIHI